MKYCLNFSISNERTYAHSQVKLIFTSGRNFNLLRIRTKISSIKTTFTKLKLLVLNTFHTIFKLKKKHFVPSYLDFEGRLVPQ